MKRHLSRRDFVKSSLIASAAIPLALRAAENVDPASADASNPAREGMPKGLIAGREFSRFMMGGNLIAGYAHARDLTYVSTLMRRYNSPSKIRETLALGEANGINVVNSWVMDDNSQIFDHWKAGGKMAWFAQVRMDAGGGHV